MCHYYGMYSPEQNFTITLFSAGIKVYIFEQGVGVFAPPPFSPETMRDMSDKETYQNCSLDK